MNTLLAMAMLLAAPRLCAGPPGYADIAAATPDKPPAAIARVVAWPGSEALLEVLLINDSREVPAARLEVSAPDKSIPAPRILLVDDESDASLPLPDYWPMGPEEVSRFLLRYRIPPDARPGRHEHTLRLTGNKMPRSQELTLTLTVVNAPQAAVRPLPAIAGLAWDAPPLEPAAAVEALEGLPLALWPRTESPTALHPEDVDAFAAAQARLETTTPLTLGNVLPPPVEGHPRGFSARVQAAKLERWPAWATDALWASGLFVELPVEGGADATARLVETLQHWKTQWPRIRAMVVGPYIPALQPHADAWALPPMWAGMAPHLAGGLQPGAGILHLEGGGDALPYREWKGLLATPDFAMDGSLATWWLTSPLIIPWMEMTNPAQRELRTLMVSADRKPALVQTSLPGHGLSDSTVTWKEDQPGQWIGTFKYPAAFERLRIQFPQSNEPIRVREIAVGDTAPTAVAVDPVAPWRWLARMDNPAAEYAALLEAEAAGCVGIHLGPVQFDSVRNAIYQRADAPRTIAWLDARRTLPSRSRLYLAQGLQDAALLRTLRMEGKLSVSRAANFLAMAQQLASSASTPEKRLELLKEMRTAREYLVSQLEP